MSDKDMIDAMKALGEMLELFQESATRLAPLVNMMEQSCAGDLSQWLKAIDKISDVDLEDAQGMLVVAAGLLGRIRHGSKQAGIYDQVKVFFRGNASAASLEG